MALPYVTGTELFEPAELRAAARTSRGAELWEGAPAEAPELTEPLELLSSESNRSAHNPALPPRQRAEHD